MATYLPTGSKIGVDLNNPATGTNFTLLDHTLGANDSEWVYCYCSGGASAGALMQISSTGTASTALATVSAQGSDLAFAQATFTDGQSGWFAKRGNPLTVLVSSTSTQFAVLYITAASGALTTTAGSGTIAGVALITASTTAVLTAFQAVVTYPRVLLSGQG